MSRAVPYQPEVVPPTTQDLGDPKPTASRRDELAAVTTGSVCLVWLPLGAGGRSVRWNGRVFEVLVARHQHREVKELYHSALEVRLGLERFVIEMTPVWGNGSTDRGVVCVGSVGARWLGISKLFRYEVRRWRDGQIGDIDEATDRPLRVSHDASQARALLDSVPQVPAATWGRDELGTGEMWNSNSLVAWLLARSGHDMTAITPPLGGRAPGWNAGLVLAARDSVSRG